MSNCAVCHKPVKSGVVVHSECMELLQKTQQLDNKPLTIEELRKMVWEAIWIVTEKLSEWCIIHSCHADDVLGGGVIMTRRPGEKRMYPYSDYGKTWLAYRRKPNDWISVNDRNPNNEELKRSECFEFLCRVLIPEKGGNVCEKTIVIKYDILDKQWVCDGMIVTHWMPLPAPPGVE